MAVEKFMQLALEQAKIAFEREEVPVGAVIVNSVGDIVAKAYNRVEELGDPTAHAEFLAMQQARKVVDDVYLEDCTLFVTLEPCAMCAQAISWSRVGKVYFGAYDVRSGGAVNGARVWNHCHFKPEFYGGILEDECVSLIQEFFKLRR